MKPLTVFGVLLFLLGSTSAAERPSKPNIVLILTDDLGWQDVKCYDVDQLSPMETPNIDALAKRGVMFWQAYAPAPTCAPSRCAILSGVHPARAQKTHVVGGAPPSPINRSAHTMMPPWYSGRMPEGEFTLAKTLKKEGYTTGHSGKWHMAIQHHAFPQPEDQGFDWTRSVRGARSRMKPNRLSDFATTDEKHPYRLDQNGFPKHENSENALEFLRASKDKPFFLYYATWLVHTPIHTRSKRLLEKYCRKLGVQPDRDDPQSWKDKGQTNPFYCAMVEELDYYLGKIFAYLETTEDPRWPGHRLSENTYVILTSDNGGMEAKVVRADLIYTLNGHARYEEWFRASATLSDDRTVTASLPRGTTHFFVNLIDANDFLVSYPDVPDQSHMRRHREKYAKYALEARQRGGAGTNRDKSGNR